MTTYDLSQLTEITQSGWTMDFFVPEDVMKANGLTSPLVSDWGDDRPLWRKINRLVADWQRTETEDGGVITYTKAED